MGTGLHFSTLAALIGKRHGARWGTRRVTIGAVGWRDGSRFVMGTLSDGTAVLGEPGDFSIPVQCADCGRKLKLADESKWCAICRPFQCQSGRDVQEV